MIVVKDKKTGLWLKRHRYACVYAARPEWAKGRIPIQSNYIGVSNWQKASKFASEKGVKLSLSSTVRNNPSNVYDGYHTVFKPELYEFFSVGDKGLTKIVIE